MRIGNILVQAAIVTGLNAPTREAAIEILVDALAAVRPIDKDKVLRDIALREKDGSTFIPAGEAISHLALPHAVTDGCKQLLMGVGISPAGVPWEPGARAHVIFLIIGPDQTQALHLRVLARIARLGGSEELLQGLREATSIQDVLRVIEAVESPLGDIVIEEGMPRFCVIGAGHGGMAMAGHLSLMGCKVDLFNRSAERLEPVQQMGGIDVTGAIEGFARLGRVTSDAAQAMEKADVVMVVVPAMAHRDVARLVAPHLKDGQIVVLNPGRTGGALEFRRIVRATNPTVCPFIAEAQTLLYSARVTNPGQVHVFGIKHSVPLASLPAYTIADILPVIRKVLPQFVPGDNVLKTSLDNIGAVFHPAITVLNASRIEDTHGDFEYYVEGVTPAVAAVLEAVDRERVEVARALGIRASTAREWLYLAYDAAGKTLLDAMRANSGYSGIKAPGTIQHRYIYEDVPASLVPIASIGDMFSVPTPAIRSIITLASAMNGVDYWKDGRTVESLGIKGMTLKQIRFLVVGADSATRRAARRVP